MGFCSKLYLFNHTQCHSLQQVLGGKKFITGLRPVSGDKNTLAGAMLTLQLASCEISGKLFHSFWSLCSPPIIFFSLIEKLFPVQFLGWGNSLAVQEVRLGLVPWFHRLNPGRGTKISQAGQCALSYSWKKGKKFLWGRKRRTIGKTVCFLILADSHSRLWGMNGLREHRCARSRRQIYLWSKGRCTGERH